MSEDWFNWYVAQVDKDKHWAMFKGRFLCPCCFMPTLEERAGYDICAICCWEDDGQDSDDAETVRGGPNKSYSLKEARENFNIYHTMYRESDEIAFSREMKNLAGKKRMYQAFTKAIVSGTESDWKSALEIEGEYHRSDS